MDEAVENCKYGRQGVCKIHSIISSFLPPPLVSPSVLHNTAAVSLSFPAEVLATVHSFISRIPVTTIHRIVVRTSASLRDAPVVCWAERATRKRSSCSESDCLKSKKANQISLHPTNVRLEPPRNSIHSLVNPQAKSLRRGKCETRIPSQQLFFQTSPAS